MGSTARKSTRAAAVRVWQPPACARGVHRAGGERIRCRGLGGASPFRRVGAMRPPATLPPAESDTWHLVRVRGWFHSASVASPHPQRTRHASCCPRTTNAVSLNGCHRLLLLPAHPAQLRPAAVEAGAYGGAQRGAADRGGSAGVRGLRVATGAGGHCRRHAGRHRAGRAVAALYACRTGGWPGLVHAQSVDRRRPDAGVARASGLALGRWRVQCGRSGGRFAGQPIDPGNCCGTGAVFVGARGWAVVAPAPVAPAGLSHTGRFRPASETGAPASRPASAAAAVRANAPACNARPAADRARRQRSSVRPARGRKHSNWLRR